MSSNQLEKHGILKIAIKEIVPKEIFGKIKQKIDSLTVNNLQFIHEKTFAWGE